jgi:CDP-diacylglycerol--glycerol-3-phosphate 3-phosphatidyltransferase
LWRHRRQEGTPLFPAFGYGTWLSLARGLLIAMAAGFLAEPVTPDGHSWTPAVLFAAAVLADCLDGYLARVEGKATLLGADLDMELDALGMLIGVALAISRGNLSWVYALIGLARYAFVFGIWARRRAHLPVHPLTPSSTRRLVAGLTMGFLSVMLWPVVRPPATTLAGALFLAPFLVSFLRDWLVVSGVIDPASARYRVIRAEVKSLLTRWVPLPLRGVLLVALTLLWLLRSAPSPEWIAGIANSSLEVVVTVGVAVEAACLALILLGIAGRIAAALLLFPLSVTILAGGLTPLRAVALVATIGILYLGTGFASLWQPEKRVFGQRANERDAQ